MTEKELQVKWYNYAKLRPQLQLQGESIQILNPGIFNENESGPDFLNASIKMGEVQLHGSIELHFKSSDWFAHGHHRDANYGNVILHVVLKMDAMVHCLGEELLQFEVPQNHLWRQLNENANFTCPPCSVLSMKPTLKTVEAEKEAMLTVKIRQKVHQFNIESRIDRMQVLYELMAIAFGMKVNQEAFWMLAKRVPIQFLLRRKPELIPGILLHVAGFPINDVSKPQKKEIVHLCRFYQIERLDRFVWKFKGLRPNGFPEVRINQLAKVLGMFNWPILNNAKIDANDSWNGAIENLPPSSRDLLTINAWVPFLAWLDARKSQMVGSSSFNAVERLKRIKPEKNQLMTRLKSCGFDIQNAYDSQALLSLYRTKCAKKNCLHCGIGQELMNI